MEKIASRGSSCEQIYREGALKDLRDSVKDNPKARDRAVFVEESGKGSVEPFSVSPAFVIAIDSKLLGDAMKNSIGMVATGFAALVVLAQTATADATEIKVLSANGIQAVLEDLGPRFEQRPETSL